MRQGRLTAKEWPFRSGDLVVEVATGRLAQVAIVSSLDVRKPYGIKYLDTGERAYDDSFPSELRPATVLDELAAIDCK